MIERILRKESVDEQEDLAAYKKNIKTNGVDSFGIQ